MSIRCRLFSNVSSLSFGVLLRGGYEFSFLYRCLFLLQFQLSRLRTLGPKIILLMEESGDHTNVLSWFFTLTYTYIFTCQYKKFIANRLVVIGEKRAIEPTLSFSYLIWAIREQISEYCILCFDLKDNVCVFSSQRTE